MCGSYGVDFLVAAAGSTIGQFHTHNRDSGLNGDPIGVSGTDLSLLSRGVFSNMSILSRGTEWNVIYGGNQYSHHSIKLGDHRYSLTNSGSW